MLCFLYFSYITKKFSKNLQSACHVQLQTRTNQISTFQIKHSQSPREKRESKKLLNPRCILQNPTRHCKCAGAARSGLQIRQTRMCRGFRPTSFISESEGRVRFIDETCRGPGHFNHAASYPAFESR